MKLTKLRSPLKIRIEPFKPNQQQSVRSQTTNLKTIGPKGPRDCPSKSCSSSHGTSSKGRNSKYPKNQSEVEDGDIPYCKNHPKLSSHWTWDCYRTIADAKAAAKATDKKSWQKKSSQSSQSTSSASKGCAWCFNDEALRDKSLTHFTKDCRLDPKNKWNQKSNSSGGKGSKTSNLHLKDALRDVLNEPAEKGRKASKKKRKGGSDTKSGEESDQSSDDIHPRRLKPRK